MRRYVFLVCAMALVLVMAGPLSWAASNLNLSKSNVNRVVYPPALTPAAATAILADLDKLGPGTDEAAIRAVVQKHRGKSAAGGNFIIRVLPPGGSPKLRTILILEHAGDEQAAAIKAGYDLKANKQAVQ